MNCEHTHKYVLDYIDNELPYALQQALDEHIGECMACRKLIDEYKKTSLLLQLRGVPDPGEAYFERTWRRILSGLRAKTFSLPHAEQSNQPDSRPWIARLRQPLILYTLAATVMLCIGGWLWYHYSDMSATYVDNDIEYIVLEDGWEPTRPDFGAIPAAFRPEMEFIRYSKAAIGGIDPISKSAVIRQVEAVSK